MRTAELPPQEIERAVAALRRGGLVAMPTETVYGLAARAFDEAAVARVFAVKGRPRFDPLIVHLADAADLDRVAASVPDAARALVDLWPGPLTLVLPKRREVPDLVTAGLPSVAVRVPAHPVAAALLRAVGEPLAAPSANPFGYVSPTTAAHVRAQLGDAVDVILDGGPCAVGVESTIVDVTGDPSVLRLGGVPLEAIEARLGRVGLRLDAQRPTAPGQLSAHYATKTPLRLGDPDGRAGEWALRFATLHPALPQERQLVLAPDGSDRSAARALFAALRALDRPDVASIAAELAPPAGLGAAINDRLRRAATPGVL